MTTVDNHEFDQIFHHSGRHIGKTMRASAQTAQTLIQLRMLRRQRDEQALNDARRRSADEAARIEREKKAQWREDYNTSRMMYEPLLDKQRWDAASVETRALAAREAASWSAESTSAHTAFDTFSARIKNEYGIDFKQFVSEELDSAKMSVREASERLLRDPIPEEKVTQARHVLTQENEQRLDREQAARHLLNDHAPQWYQEATGKTVEGQYRPNVPADAIRDAQTVLETGTLPVTRQQEIWYAHTHPTTNETPTRQELVDHWLATAEDRGPEQFTSATAQSFVQRLGVPAEHQEHAEMVARGALDQLNNFEQLTDLVDAGRGTSPEAVEASEKFDQAFRSLDVDSLKELRDRDRWDRLSVNEQMTAVAASRVAQWHQEPLTHLTNELNDRLITDHHIDMNALIDDVRSGTEAEHLALRAPDVVTAREVDEALTLSREATQEWNARVEAAHLIAQDRAPQWYRDALAAQQPHGYDAIEDRHVIEDMNDLLTQGNLSDDVAYQRWDAVQEAAARREGRAYEYTEDTTELKRRWEETTSLRSPEEPQPEFDTAVQNLRDSITQLHIDELREQLSELDQHWLDAQRDSEQAAERDQIHDFAQAYQSEQQVPPQALTAAQNARLDNLQNAPELPEYTAQWINEQRLAADASNDPSRLEMVTVAAEEYALSGTLNHELLERSYEESLPATARDLAQTSREIRESTTTIEKETTVSENTHEDAERPEMTERDRDNLQRLHSGYGMTRQESIGAARKRGTATHSAGSPDLSHGRDHGLEI